MKTLTKALLAAAVGCTALAGYWTARPHGEAARRGAAVTKNATPLAVFLRIDDPATVHALPNVLEIARELGDAVTVDAHVLASPNNAEADALARCASAQGGAKALRFVVCRQGMGRGNDDWSACADEATLDKTALDTCAKGPESATLATRADDAAASRGVQRTPALFLGDAAIEGDGTRAALTKAVCDSIHPTPALCAAAPIAASSGFPITVLTDTRCAECRAPFWFRRMQMLFPSADVRIVDVQSEAGRAHYERLAPALLPAIVFDPRVEQDPGFSRIERELVKKDGFYTFSPASVRPAFDPTKS